MEEKRASLELQLLAGEPEEVNETLPRWEEPTKPAMAPIREQITTALCVLLNTVSTVTLVILSKRVFSDPQLKNCQVLVVMWHFLTTAIVLYLATKGPFKAFKAVRLPIRSMIPICAFFVGYVILGNLSLTYNSIGFYQLAKVMTTPTVVLLNFLLFQKKITGYMTAAIAAVCIGVGLTISGSMSSNLFGIIIAILAFTVAAFYQIWIGKKIEDLNVTAPQLLLNQAPLSVLLLIPFVPFFDTMPNISLVPKEALLSLFATGIMASLLNLSQFLIIGRTSALTFNIVSHLKTILILSFGWYSESKIFSAQDMIGVFLALGGGWLYSYLSMMRK